MPTTTEVDFMQWLRLSRVHSTLMVSVDRRFNDVFHVSYQKGKSKHHHDNGGSVHTFDHLRWFVARNDRGVLDRCNRCLSDRVPTWYVDRDLLKLTLFRGLFTLPPKNALTNYELYHRLGERRRGVCVTMLREQLLGSLATPSQVELFYDQVQLFEMVSTDQLQSVFGFYADLEVQARWRRVMLERSKAQRAYVRVCRERLRLYLHLVARRLNLPRNLPVHLVVEYSVSFRSL